MTTEIAAIEVAARNRRLGLRLALLVLAMIAFAPVLWYTGSLLCDWAGIGIAPGGDGPRSEITVEVESTP